MPIDFQQTNFQQTNYQDFNWLTQGMNIKYDKRNDYYLGKSRRDLIVIKGKKDSWKWLLIFLTISVIIGIATQGIGNIIFAGLLSGTALTEGASLIISGTVQTVLEVAGQAVINILSGHTDKVTWILTAMPGLGVFGLGRVQKGIKLMKNENLMLKSLIKNKVDLKTAKELVRYTSLYTGGKNLEENLFISAIQNGDVEAVRTFREKIYRSSGIGVKNKYKEFYKSQSKRFGHETIDDYADLISKRLSGLYDLRWIQKQNRQRLTKLFGSKWVIDKENKDILYAINKGINEFKEFQALAKNNWYNKYINRPINTLKFKKIKVKTKEDIGIKYDYFNPKTGKWSNKTYMYDNIKGDTFNKTKFMDYTSSKIYKEKYKRKFVYEKSKDLINKGIEPDRLIDYTFKTIKNVTNPLRLIKPTNLIRKSSNKAIKEIEKLAMKFKWFDRIIKHSNKAFKTLPKIKKQLIMKLNLIPAINSDWQIGFKILNEIGVIRVEIYYWNKATQKIVQVQRNLNPYQFERMLVAYESGQAGEFYNKELALGWGLKKSWINSTILTQRFTSLKVQTYLYSSLWAYRNIKSAVKGINSWKSGKYQDYNWKQNIKDYTLLRFIRNSGRLVGLGWLTGGLGVALYRGIGYEVNNRKSDVWKYGITNSTSKITRKYAQRWRKKQYYNPRKRKLRK